MEITPQTQYTAILLVGGVATIPGPFVLVRIYESGDGLMGYYKPSTGYFYPESRVMMAFVDTS